MACQFSIDYPIYIHISGLPIESQDLVEIDLSDCIYDDNLLPYYLLNNLAPNLEKLILISYYPLPHKFILEIGNYIKKIPLRKQITIELSATPNDFKYLKSLITDDNIELMLCCYTDESKTNTDKDTLSVDSLKAKSIL